MPEIYQIGLAWFKFIQIRLKMIAMTRSSSIWGIKIFFYEIIEIVILGKLWYIKNLNPARNLSPLLRKKYFLIGKSTSRITNPVSVLTGRSQMVTKSLSEKNRYDKKAFLLKNNDKFGFLVKNLMEIKFLNMNFSLENKLWMQ